MNEKQIRDRAIGLLMEAWYWQAVLVVWLVMSLVIPLAIGTGHDRAALVGIIIWAGIQVVIRIGILSKWKQARA